MNAHFDIRDAEMVGEKREKGRGDHRSAMRSDSHNAVSNPVGGVCALHGGKGW